MTNVNVKFDGPDFDALFRVVIGVCIMATLFSLAWIGINDTAAKLFREPLLGEIGFFGAFGFYFVFVGLLGGLRNLNKTVVVKGELVN